MFDYDDDDASGPTRVPEGFGAVCRGPHPGLTRFRPTRRSLSSRRRPSRARRRTRPPKKKPLLDKDGREYRVCDMCGGNMYKQEKTWTCEQCGFSYEE